MVSLMNSTPSKSNVTADLEMYGAWGFQPYWLNKHGYTGTNMLKTLADRCFSRGLQVCAVTSTEFDIPRGSVHDRFNFLIESFGNSLPHGYATTRAGKNGFMIVKDNNRVTLLNGQTVIVQNNGKRIDHLVVGSNEVPNKMNLDDTLRYGRDNGLLQVASHPWALGNFGMGEDLLKSYLDQYDAIEGHNSFFGRAKNEKAQSFARDYQKPWIAVSNAKRFQDVGNSFITIDKLSLTNDSEKIVQEMRDQICKGKFYQTTNYTPALTKLRLGLIFKIGLLNRIKNGV